MTLALYYHPLSSFCWKALIALYELELPFEPLLVNLGDADERAAFAAVWPLCKFPVLRDGVRIIPESTPIIEHLDKLAGGGKLLPTDTDAACAVRAADRFYDLYVHHQMQKIVSDRIRPEGKRDPFGEEQTRATMATALSIVEADINAGWAVGETFTMADCSAMPALYYANRVAPFEATHPRMFAYLQRLTKHPSVARTLREAEPYLHMFPA